LSNISTNSMPSRWYRALTAKIAYFNERFIKNCSKLNIQVFADTIEIINNANYCERKLLHKKE